MKYAKAASPWPAGRWMVPFGPAVERSAGKRIGTMVISPPDTRRRRSRRRRFIYLSALLLIIIAGIGTLALALLTLAITNQARQDETEPADAIVVLGAAQWNGRPSPAFKARLDHARELFEQGMAPIIVLTGGTGKGDTYSEAEVGEVYLLEQGIPARAMFTVSGDTSYQSLTLASELLHERAATRVLLVSDPFHMFRIKRMAHDLGLSPLASPTQTSPIHAGSDLEQRYMAREVAAYVAYLFFRQ